jgi:hypothetical protein
MLRAVERPLRLEGRRVVRALTSLGIQYTVREDPLRIMHL